MRIKKFACIVITLIIASSFSGCKNKTENAKSTAKEDEYFLSVSIGEVYIEERLAYDIKGITEYNKIKLSDSDAEKYPDLNKVIEEYNELLDESAEVTMESFLETSELMDDFGVTPDALIYSSDFYIERADTTVLSVLENAYYYEGGIHGNYGYYGMNYDTVTGEELLLETVIVDEDKFREILEEKVIDKYKDVIFSNAVEDLKEYALEDFTWIMDYQGIVLWFSPYELAPYSEGGLNVRIFFDEFPEIFSSEYVEELPDNYIKKISFYENIEFDLDKNDGEIDVISVEPGYGEEWDYKDLSITINGKTLNCDIPAYSYDTYLVHMNDKNYLYCEIQWDGTPAVFVFDINGSKPRKISELYGFSLPNYFGKDDTLYRKILNNPSHMNFESVFYGILGTRFGVADYEVGEDGLPSIINKYFRIEDEMDVTSLIPLEAELLPDMKKIQIPAGTTFSAIGTDGETYIDLVADDGREVRFMIDKSDGRPMINGNKDYECFEGIVDAG